MEWQQVVLIGFFLFSTGATMALVGRKRDPITPGMVLFNIVITAILIALVATI